MAQAESITGRAMQAEIRHRELKKLGLKAKIILIGKKGITYFNRRQKEYNIAGEHVPITVDVASLTCVTQSCRPACHLSVAAVEYLNPHSLDMAPAALPVLALSSSHLQYLLTQCHLASNQAHCQIPLQFKLIRRWDQSVLTLAWLFLRPLAHNF